jgi:hypothetical protein
MLDSHMGSFALCRGRAVRTNSLHGLVIERARRAGLDVLRPAAVAELCSATNAGANKLVAISPICDPWHCRSECNVAVWDVARQSGLAAYSLADSELFLQSSSS